MSETYIPLERALSDLKCRPSLLKKLRNGDIPAYAAESFGAELVEWCVAETVEEILKRVFTYDVERRVALRALNDQHSSAKYICASEGYFAIIGYAPDFAAFIGRNRKSEGRAPLPRSLWRHAFIDESRRTVVYDDFQDLWRKEFMHVHIDDAVYRRIRRDTHGSKKTNVGRPVMYRQDVARYAENLANNKPLPPLLAFLKMVQEGFPGEYLGSKNTVDEHYGDFWRRAAGRPLRGST